MLLARLFKQAGKHHYYSLGLHGRGPGLPTPCHELEAPASSIGRYRPRWLLY